MQEGGELDSRSWHSGTSGGGARKLIMKGERKKIFNKRSREGAMGEQKRFEISFYTTWYGHKILQQ